MTAKEIWKREGLNLDNYSQSVFEAMKKYAEEKCEKQRELCALSCDDPFYYEQIVKSSIPDFD